MSGESAGRTRSVGGCHGRQNLGAVLEFMRLIWGVSHGLQAASKRMEASLGVTGPQRLALRVVGRRPGISAGDLARTLRLHPSTLTGVLQRLEARRLLVRTWDADDRRHCRLALTADGRDVDRRRRGTVEAAVRRVLAKASPGVLVAAAAVLADLDRELEATGSLHAGDGSPSSRRG